MILQFPDLKAEERRAAGEWSTSLLKMYGVEGLYYERIEPAVRNILDRETKIVYLKRELING
jgi:hypothetical protein